MMLENDRDASLEQRAAAAETYVRHAFGASLSLHPLATPALPHFLLDRYRFWQGSLLGQPLILMAVHELGRDTTADMAKHRDLIRQRLDAPLVLILIDRVSAATRKQMVARQIGFLVPGTQLYVPEAFLDLRERSRRLEASPPETFSPTAQTMLLASLLGTLPDDANLTQLADRFRIAIMSVSRALDELEAFQIAKARHVGRQRRLDLVLRGSSLWRAVESRLQSPVKKVRLIDGNFPIDQGPLAGTSALAHYTMLSPPRIERRAIAAFAWKRVAGQYALKLSEAYDPERIEVETWSYDPLVLSSRPVVDPLSLYLSVRNDPDERVAQAAEQLLESIAW